MTLRPQTISIAVLLIALGLIFVLVGNAGVSTGVFLPEPTASPIPPTATPMPDPAVANWSEVTPGQVTYAADLEKPAQIVYETLALDTFVQQTQLQHPAEDAPLPLLDLLAQRGDRYAEDIESLQLNTESGGIDNPVVEMFGGVPVALLRISLAPQTLPDGREFSGLELVEGLIDRGEGEVTSIEYSLAAEPDPIVYNDFRAWLDANAAKLAGQDHEAASEADAQDVEAEEPAEDQTQPEVTEETATNATTDAPEDAPAEDAAEVMPEATEEAAAPARGWTEVGEGQYLHASNPNAFIGHQASTITTLAGQLGIVAPAEDAEQPLLDLLTAVKNDLEFQINEAGATVAEGSLEGPEMRTFDAVPVAYFHIASEPLASAEGATFPGQELALIIIDQGEGNIRLVQMQYIFETEADPIIYADFQAWLEDNAAALMTLVESEAPAPAAEATAEPE